MSVTTRELTAATELFKSLLEELELDAYLFEVEPRDSIWEMKFECANETDGAWTTINLQFDQEHLHQALNSESSRDGLRALLQRELTFCKSSQLTKQ